MRGTKRTGQTEHTYIPRKYKEGEGAMNQTAKQLIEQSAEQEYIEKLTEVLQTFNQSIQILSEQMEYLIEILE